MSSESNTEKGNSRRMLTKSSRPFPHNSTFQPKSDQVHARVVWKMGLDLRIVDVGDGLFQFKFTLESQLKWVLNNGPWSFDNHPLVLRQWERGMTAASVTFQTLPIWIQIWGLPFDLLTEETGRDIGNGIGKVVEIDATAFTTDQARFIRIRLEVPLDKPIRRGGVVLSPEGDKLRVGFKYERLTGLCYNCGILGHEAKDCSTPRDSRQVEPPYGKWLKASHQRKEENSTTPPQPPRNSGPSVNVSSSQPPVQTPV